MSTPDLPASVDIYDTTLRDGQQTQGVQFSLDEKREIATMLPSPISLLPSPFCPSVAQFLNWLTSHPLREGLPSPFPRFVNPPSSRCVQGLKVTGEMWNLKKYS